jgi:hypothetical protein
MIDYIPLAEVEAIRIMETPHEAQDFIKASSCDSKSTSRGTQDFCSLLIKTAPDGQNGGRDYYLRADSAEECKGIVRTLERASSSAKFRVNANTRFAKSQFAVRKIHVSGPFHYTSAFLIAAVSATWDSRQSRQPLDFSSFCFDHAFSDQYHRCTRPLHPPPYSQPVSGRTSR